MKRPEVVEVCGQNSGICKNPLFMTSEGVPDKSQHKLKN